MNLILKRVLYIGIITLFSAITRAEVIEIDNQKLQELIKNGTTVVDIRRPDEWQALGLVEESFPITFFDASGAYDAQDWLSQTSLIAKKDQPIVLICLHGTRSKMVSQWLSDKAGYDTVYNVSKGIDHWIEEGNRTLPLH